MKTRKQKKSKQGAKTGSTRDHAMLYIQVMGGCNDKGMATRTWTKGDVAKEYEYGVEAGVDAYGEERRERRRVSRQRVEEAIKNGDQQ